MKLTSAEASKLLRQLTDELAQLSFSEQQAKSFLAAVGEDPETVRPEYSYAETKEKTEELQKKIRKLKHAINVFNSTTKVPGFDMTIDEMLVYLPQLQNLKAKYAEMGAVLPKARERAYGSSSNILDYRYTNYDVKEAQADYKAVFEEITKAQTALDKVNNSETFKFEF